MSLSERWTVSVFCMAFVILTAEGCRQEEFMCVSNKECISLNWRCNNVTDCNDGTDEEGCPVSTTNETTTARNLSTTMTTMTMTIQEPSTTVSTPKFVQVSTLKSVQVSTPKSVQVSTPKSVQVSTPKSVQVSTLKSVYTPTSAVTRKPMTTPTLEIRKSRRPATWDPATWGNVPTTTPYPAAAPYAYANYPQTRHMPRMCISMPMLNGYCYEMYEGWISQPFRTNRMPCNRFSVCDYGQFYFCTCPPYTRFDRRYGQCIWYFMANCGAEAVSSEGSVPESPFSMFEFKKK